MGHLNCVKLVERKNSKMPGPNNKSTFNLSKVFSK